MASNQRHKTEDRNVTLRDVAHALGVSKATVSLAINRSDLVARKTRDRILEKVDELGYIYNRSAAGLSTGRTRAVGLAVHDITNPYFTEVSAAIESVLSQNSMISFLCNTNESLERQERFIQTLVEYRADGLILNPAAGTTVKTLQPLISRRLPTVLLTRDVKGLELDFVGCDDIEETERFYVQLTTIKIHKRSIGRTAADMLMRRIVDPELSPQRIIMKPELVIRNSCHKSIHPENFIKDK